MVSHPYGWMSLLPPIAAIVLAIATRRVVTSLIAGIFVGALVTTRGDVWQALVDTCEQHLWPTLVDEGRLRVFSFTLMMGAMIGVMTRCGGMRGLINLVAPFANTRRRGQLATWFLGMLIFFDDYANTILLGGTLRPICDRLKISREKLAYLVDSTAAPVAGLALVSTWVAVEIAYIASGLENIPGDTGLDAFRLFIASIPYRFYMLMALLFVPMTAILGREFGPMWHAERAAIRGNRSERPANRAIEQLDEVNQESPWYNAVLPIVVTLTVVVILIYQTGVKALQQDPGFDLAAAQLRDIVGAGESSFALQYGALCGLFTAGLLARLQGLLGANEVVDAALAGARVVLPAIAILWSAAALSSMTGGELKENVAAATSGEPGDAALPNDDGGDQTDIESGESDDPGPYFQKKHRLYTGDFLKSKLLDQSEGAAERSQIWLPTIVFVLSAVVAFCTGTSWGTMGILVPMVVSLTHAVLMESEGVIDPSNPILLCCIGGVLAGAVFGDHCSPLSDTTVLSSQSCGCDHIAHVWTQMPYALVVAVVSILLGTLPIGFGVSIWILLPLQFVASGLDSMVRGKTSDRRRGERHMMWRCIGWLLLSAALPLAAEEPPRAITLTDQGRAVHERAILVDGHNDLPWVIRMSGSASFEKLDISQPQPNIDTDIGRLREGGMDVQFWSVWVPADTMFEGSALATTLEQIDLVEAMVERYPETFGLARSVDDIERLVGEGKIASLIGVEGGHSIENSLQVLRQLYARGARYMTLTHSLSLDWADSATDEQKLGGLSPFGEEVVREMNRLGMLVDLSHVSEECMEDALRVTAAPVIFSHSSARAIADHPRNVSDTILRKLSENGGVVMINFFSGYLLPDGARRGVARSEARKRFKEAHGEDRAAIRAELQRWDAAHPSEQGDISIILDHIDHVVEIAGIDHVGLGSDFDGIPYTPRQLDDVSDYPKLTQGMLDRGYSEEDIQKVLGGNLLRVMREAEKVAEAG